MKPVNMLEGPVSKSIVRFSVPMFLTYLIQLLYHTTDTLFVGRFLGTNAQAAVGTGGNLITLIIGLLGGITTGVSVVIGHHFGAKDREGLSRATTTAAFLVLAMSLLFTVFGVLFCGTYLHLVHTPDEIFPTAVQYLRVYCLSIPAMVTYNVAVGMLRATGDSFRPMLFQLFGGILNLGLDALFLAVLRTGAVGSALVRSSEQTMPLLVVLVMAQLVFSGGMIPVTGRDGLDEVSRVFPGRWGFAAAASDIDLNKLVPTLKKDDLWAHTTDQWWTDIAVMAGMVVFLAIVLRVCVSNAVAKHMK